MTKPDKIVEKFRKNPASVPYMKIESVLLRLGFTKSYGKGSHIKFFNSIFDITFIISVHKRECKEIYKKEIQKELKNKNLI